MFAVVENGAWTAYKSSWAALFFATDLLVGPAAFTELVRGFDKAEWWYDDIWGEGGAVVDIDRRTVLWFSWHVEAYEYRRAVHNVMTRTWPNWEIRWAHDGVCDLANYVGLDGADLHRKSYGSAWEMPESPEDDGPADYVVTVRHDDGRLTAHLMVRDPQGAFLPYGPVVLDLLPEPLSADALPIPVPPSGVHVNLDERFLGLRSPDGPKGLFRHWPGWHCEFWEDRHAEHVARAGGEVIFAPPNMDWAYDALRTSRDDPVNVPDHYSPLVSEWYDQYFDRMPMLAQFSRRTMGGLDPAQQAPALAAIDDLRRHA